MKICKRIAPDLSFRIYATKSSSNSEWIDLTAKTGAASFREILERATAGSVASASISDSLRGLSALQDFSSPVDFDGTFATAQIDDNSKVLCVGFNFGSHAKEANRTLPEHPTLFVRYPQSLVGDAETLAYPVGSSKYDWEGEVAVMIGRPARRVKREEAWSYVAGGTLFGDHSARDFQEHSTQATAGKNFERSGSIGPWIDLVGNGKIFNAVSVVTVVNGTIHQSAFMDELIFDVPSLIEYISSFMLLNAGDVIALGTPKGVGHKMVPPLYLSPGDTVLIKSNLYGELLNTVGDVK